VRVYPGTKWKWLGILIGWLGSLVAVYEVGLVGTLGLVIAVLFLVGSVSLLMLAAQMREWEHYMIANGRFRESRPRMRMSVPGRE
jgi:hypothetical protein